MNATAQTYEFRVHHTDNRTSAYYTASHGVTALEEWFGRTLEDFTRGMANRGFRYHVERNDICGRRWDSHYWSK